METCLLFLPLPRFLQGKQVLKQKCTQYSGQIFEDGRAGRIISINNFRSSKLFGPLAGCPQRHSFQPPKGSGVNPSHHRFTKPGFVSSFSVSSYNHHTFHLRVDSTCRRHARTPINYTLVVLKTGKTCFQMFPSNKLIHIQLFIRVCTSMLLAKLLAFGGHGFPGGMGLSHRQEPVLKLPAMSHRKVAPTGRKTNRLKTVEGEERKR